MCGQAEQVMFSTASVTVFSAANGSLTIYETICFARRLCTSVAATLSSFDF
jgi:hypothetical protein